MIRLPTVETLAAHNPPWRAAHFSKPISTVGLYVYTLLCDWCNLAASDRMSQGSRRFLRCHRLWTEARLATMAGDGLGIVEHVVIAADGGASFYAGPDRAPPGYAVRKRGG